MGHGGAAPMQVEIGEDNARQPTDEFISRGENVFAKFDLVKSKQNFSEILAKFDRAKSYCTGLYRYQSTPVPVPVKPLQVHWYLWYVQPCTASQTATEAQLRVKAHICAHPSWQYVQLWTYAERAYSEVLACISICL